MIFTDTYGYIYGGLAKPIDTKVNLCPSRECPCLGIHLIESLPMWTHNIIGESGLHCNIVDKPTHPQGLARVLTARKHKGRK